MLIPNRDDSAELAKASLGPSEVAEKFCFFHENSGVLICRLCSSSSFKSLAGIRTHLKERHGQSVNLGRDFVNAVILRSATLRIQVDMKKRDVNAKSTVSNKGVLLSSDAVPKALDGAYKSELQLLYWSAPASLKEKTRRLLSIPYLPIVNRFQCPEETCLYCGTDEGVRSHIRNSHSANSTLLSEKLLRLPTLTLQRLSAGGASKYFPVEVVAPEVIQQAVHLSDCTTIEETRNDLDQTEANPNDGFVSMRAAAYAAIEVLHPVSAGLIARKKVGAGLNEAAGTLSERHQLQSRTKNIADDLLLGDGRQSSVQAKELYEELCNFKSMLFYIGCRSLLDVPTELTALDATWLLSKKQKAQNRAPVENDASRSKRDAASCFAHGENDEKLYAVSSLLENMGFDERVVKEDIVRYLWEGRKLAFESSDNLRRIVSTRDLSSIRSHMQGGAAFQCSQSTSVSNAQLSVLFKPVSTAATIEKYAAQISGLVLFCIRTVAVGFAVGMKSRKSDPLTKDAIPSCSMGNLPNLSRVQRAVLEDRCAKITELLPNEVWHAATLYLMRSIERKCGEDAEECNVCASSTSKQPNVNCHCRQDEVRAYLHLLLKAVLLFVVDGPPVTNGLVLRHFTAIQAVWDVGRTLESRRLKKASEMSPLLASLLYCCSTCGVLEMTSYCTQHTKLARDCADITKISPRFKKLVCGMQDDDLRLSFSLDRNNAVSWLRSMMGKTMHVLRANHGSVRFIQCNTPGHESCAWVDGVECSFQTLRQAVFGLQERLRKVLHSDLLFEMALEPEFWKSMEQIQDHLMMDNRGMNMLSRKCNEEFAMKSNRMLLNHILKDAQLRKGFLVQDAHVAFRGNDNGGQFATTETSENGTRASTASLFKTDSTTVRRFKASCKEALEIVSVLAHVTGGAPARASELVTCTLENTAEAMRNVYYHQGQIFLRITYNKTMSLTSKDTTIVRFLDRETSRLLSVLIFIVRPLQVALTATEKGEAAARRQALYLFAHDGEPFRRERIPLIVKKWLSKHDILFSFSQYRHWQSGMVETFSKHNRNTVLLHGWSEEEDGEYMLTNTDDEVWDGSGSGPYGISAMHEQAGHSTETANRVYGQSVETFRGVAAGRFAQFQRASQAWHVLLRISTDWDIVGASYHCIRTNIDRPGSRMKQKEANVSQNKTMCGGEALDLSSSAVNEMPVQIYSKQIQSQPGKHPRDSRVQRHQLHKEQHPSWSGLRNTRFCGRDIERRRSILKALRTAVQSTSAVFSCQAQEEAIAYALDRREDVVVVLGTGKGKSAIFQTVAIMEKEESLLTIVVVPLVALLQDHLRECKDIGICVGTWEGRSDRCLQILFLTVEQVTGTSFQNFLVQVCASGRLARFVIDESHLTTMWSLFRPAMLRVSNCIFHPSMTIQRILLSATVPPSLMEETSRMHGLSSNFQVVRTCTARENISYHVKYCETPQSDKDGSGGGKIGNNSFVDSRSRRFISDEDFLVDYSKKEVFNEMSRIATTVCIDEKAKQTNVGGGGNTTMVVLKRQIIVYCPSRRLVDDTSQAVLTEQCVVAPPCSGRNVIVKDIMPYYANLQKEVKEENQRKWMLSADQIWKGLSEEEKGDSQSAVHVIIQVMVATCAFGTGINSKHVASVIHLGFSRSLAEYAQESGRAGRDGQAARSIIIYSKRYADKHARRLAGDVPESVLAMFNSTNSEKLMTSFETRDGLRIRETEQAFAQFVSWVETRGECRRASLAAYLDGCSLRSCIHSPSIVESSVCDNCNDFVASNHMQKTIQRHAANWDAVDISEQRSRTSNCNDFLASKHMQKTIQRHAANRDAADISDQRRGTSNSPAPLPSALHFGESQKRRADAMHTDNYGNRDIDVLHKRKSMKLSLRQSTRSSDSLPTGSSEANRVALTENRQAVTEIISEFHADVDDIKGICIVCFALAGERHPESDNIEERRKCYKVRKVCYKCLRQKCSYTACPLLGRSVTAKNGAAKARSICRDCGLMTFRGEYIHPWNEFGPKCGIRKSLLVCMGAWYIPSIREELIRRYNLCEDWNSNAEHHQIAFLQWLREIDSAGEKLNVMRVYHDILHENQ